MPVYTTKDARGPCGYSIGVLLLDYRGPFVPGDVGNATSYPYPVLYKTVPGATSKRVFLGDPELEEAVVLAARQLEAQGVKGISSDCGFFLNYQEAVNRAVRIPVFLSSLLQLPFIAAMIGCRRSIGVIAANGRALDSKVLALAGVHPDCEIVVRGLETEPVFGGSITGSCVQLDTDQVEAELVQVCRHLVHNHRNMGAILIECSMLPPYSRAVQEATGLPVFDFLTMIDFFQQASARTGFVGQY